MNKGLLVIGANSDIAKETIKYFAKDGYDLFLGVRDKNQLTEFVQDLKIRYNSNCEIIELDLTKMDTHAKIWDEIKDKVNGVMLAAGYLPNQAEAEKNWDITLNTINVNFTGAISFLNLVANTFEDRKNGFIIGISSVAGDRGRGDNYIYGSTKAGLTAYLSGLRNRLFNYNVYVLTVKPGPVYTKMTSNLKLSELLTAKVEKVGVDIYKAFKAKQDVLYTPGYWYIIMAIFKHIPEFIFKKTKIKDK